MKRTNKGFTLVELIIVIAVIGVLAAILIPTFANVIDKANAKSAKSDARNALSIWLSENTDGAEGGILAEGSIFYVEGKGAHTYSFTYDGNGLDDGAVDAAEPAGPSYVAHSDANSKVPANVTIYIAQ